MLFTTVIGLFLGGWSVVLLVDYYLRDVRQSERYARLVQQVGLAVSPFHIRVYAEGGRFQRVYDRWTCLRWPKMKSFLDVWFSVGVGASVFASLFMLYLLTLTLVQHFNALFSVVAVNKATLNIASKDSNLSFNAADRDGFAFGNDQPSIVPIVPGLNMPWSHAPILFLILVIAGICHELGHALAAANERVNVNGFGVFLLGIYPGAFTELEHQGLLSVSAAQRLKIFCGGIWHNLLTALLAVLCIACLPTMLSFGYTVDKGVLVRDVHALSGLGEAGGLLPGDVVYEINGCPVSNEESWLKCLSGLHRQDQGFCIPRFKARFPSPATTSRPFVDRDGELKCCSPNATSSHLCFYFRNAAPAESYNSSLNSTMSYSCLPARYVTDHMACNHSQPCRALSQTVCAYAALFNQTKLLRFQLDARRGLKRQPVLFVGHARAVLEHVTVSGYVPRHYLTPRRSILPAPEWMPHMLDLLLRYLFTMSLAFALLNAVPCYSLDGQYIWAVLVNESKCRRVNSAEPAANALDAENVKSRFGWTSLVYRAVMWYGTLALVAVVLWGVATSFIGSF